MTESMPASVTPRRMKGITVVGQVHALGQAAGGHHAAVAGLRQGVGQGVGAHRIDDAGPAFLLEGFARRRQARHGRSPGSAQLFQVASSAALPVAATTV
jgi:hypothetical protein